MSELSKQNSYFDYKTNYSLLTSHSTILCGHVEVASKKATIYVLGSTMEKTQWAEIVDQDVSGQDGNGVKSNTPMILEPVYQAATDDIKVPIHLTKGKRAYLGYPADINAKDIKLLEHAIQGILLRLNLESDDES